MGDAHRLDAMNRAPTIAQQPVRIIEAGRLRCFALNAPAWRVTVIVTAVICVLSVLVTALMAYFILGSRELLGGLLIGFVVPLLTAPPIVWKTTRLTQQLAQARQLLEQLAVIDPLTGLYNRRHLYEAGAQEIERARRQAVPLAALVIDLDDFKQVNDAHGHIAGDALLRAVAASCRASVRPYDIVARHGGEELVVLSPSTSVDEALQLAERLREAIAALAVATESGVRLTPTASIGVATYDRSQQSLAALLDDADRAMYVAKRGGKNRVALAPPRGAAPTAG